MVSSITVNYTLLGLSLKAVPSQQVRHLCVEQRFWRTSATLLSCHVY